MFSVCQHFRRYLTVQTVGESVNKINGHRFESCLINTGHALCTATKFDNKYDQTNRQSGGEIQNQIVSKVESIFKCNTIEAKEIFNELKESQTNPSLSDIVLKVKWLRQRNIQLSTILDNYKLLLQPLAEIKSVYTLLKKMSWSKPDHILPFVSMSFKEIEKLETFELNRIRNRVYWLAAELKSDPYLVAKNCIKHPFILWFNDHLKLRRKIQLLLEYGLSTEDIMKDFFNLALGEENLKRRLSLLKANGIDNCLPWMLRGREKAIQILLKHRHELGPDEIQTLDNLAKTLKLHGHTAKKLFKRHKFIQNLDAHQMSSVLQFLLERFTADEIVKNIGMLLWSVPELERRISEAKALGIECLDPICLTKSEEVFQEWLKKFAKSKECKFEANDDTQGGELNKK